MYPLPDFPLLLLEHVGREDDEIGPQLAVPGIRVQGLHDPGVVRGLGVGDVAKQDEGLNGLEGLVHPRRGVSCGLRSADGDGGLDACHVVRFELGDIALGVEEGSVHSHHGALVRVGQAGHACGQRLQTKRKT